MTRHKGFALIQVLMLTSVLLTLATVIVVKVNTQVASAQALNFQTEAMIQGESAYQALLYALSTRDKYSLYRGNGFNFFGKPFRYQNVDIEIQDFNGLFSVSGKTPVLLIERWLQAITPQDVPSASQLLQWISSNKQGQATLLLQYPQQLMEAGMTEEQAEMVWNQMSVVPKAMFNPGDIPEKSLGVYMDDARRNEVIALREQPLSWQEYVREVAQITGLVSDEGVGYTIGPYYRVKVISEVNGSHWGQEYNFKLQAKANKIEYILFSRRPL